MMVPQFGMFLNDPQRWFNFTRPLILNFIDIQNGGWRALAFIIAVIFNHFNLLNNSSPSELIGFSSSHGLMMVKSNNIADGAL